MKNLKKVITILLTCVIFVTSMPTIVFATSEVEEARNVYLSDLYYAYSAYLVESEYMDKFYEDTHGAIEEVYLDYVKSKSYDATLFRGAISSVANLGDLLKYATDVMGLTQFTYNDMLDSANIEFAKKILYAEGVDESSEEIPEHLEKVSENLQLTSKYYETIADICRTETSIKVLKKVFEAEEIKSLFKHIDSYDLSCVYDDIVSKWEAYSQGLEVAADIADFTQGLITALMIEDTRIDIINAIYENAPEDEAPELKKGMKKLQWALENGFAEYFVATYLSNELIDKVYEGIVDGVFLKYVEMVCPPFAIIAAVSEIASDVILGGIFHIPSVDDLFTQMGLMYYHEQLKTTIESKAKSFNTQFAASDIREFELLVSAMGALTIAVADATEEFANADNKALLVKARKRGNERLYDNLVLETKEEIRKATEEELESVRTRYNDKVDENGAVERGWYIDGTYELVSPSDTIEEGKLYCTNNIWLGDFFFHEVWSSIIYALVVPEKENITVEGSLDDGDSNVTDGFSDGWAILSVQGELTLNGNVVHIGELVCDGLMHIRGDVDTMSVVMNQEEAELRVSGNFNVHPDYCQISSGTIVFNGNCQQEVYCPLVNNLYVENKQGIKYLGDVHVVGTFLLNGNELDNNNYETYLDSSNALIDSVSDYKSVQLNSDYTLRNNIICDLHVNKKSLTIPEKSDVMIDGDVALAVGSNFNVDGSVLVNGNFTFEYEATLYGCTTFLNMSESKAVFAVTGDFAANDIQQCNVTNGLFFLAGNTLQKVDNLKAHNFKVKNQEGIQYLSDIYVTGRYELCDTTLENGNYSTIVSEKNVTFDSVSDYKKILVETEWNLNSSFKGNVVVKKGASVLAVEDASALIDGNLTLRDGASLIIDGRLCLGGDLVCDGSVLGSGTEKTLTNSNAILEIKGNLITNNWDPFEFDEGTIIFSGTEVQSVKELTAHNIEVRNGKGIKYNSSLRFSGEYILNGYPLDNGNYKTIVASDTAKFDGVSNYKDLLINIPYNLTGNLCANIKLDDGGALTVDKDDSVAILGNITAGYDTSLNIEGQLDMNGDIKLNWSQSYLNMNESNALLALRGDCEAPYCNITDGTVNLCGTETQNIMMQNFATLILNNTSEGGVVFSRKIAVSKLFEHNNQQFTLYNNGKESTFVDYDGDSMLDYVDPEPTLFDTKVYYGKTCNINNDAVTDIRDFIRIKKGFDQSSREVFYDLNGDSKFDIYDVLIMRMVLVADYSFHK